MRYIDFISFGVENYCQFQEPKEFYFEKGITLISGSNGIGKTNFLDAIGFTNYGVTSKGLKGSDVVNNRVGKDCHTWNKFRNRDTEELYTIDRYYNHSKYGNSVLVWKDGIDEPLERKTSESGRLIEQLTLPSKLFFNRISFGQKIKTFFTTLGPSEQRDIFRKLFALELYEIWQKMADNVLKEEKDNLEKIILDLRTDHSLLEREKELLRQIKEEREIFYKNKKEVLLKLSEEINRKTNYQNSLSFIIQSLYERNHDEKYTEVISEIASVKGGLEKINEAKEEKVSEIRQKRKVEIQQDITEIQNEFLVEEKKLIEEKNKKIESLNDKSSQINSKILELRGNVKLLENKIEANKNLIEHIVRDMDKYRKNLDSSVCPECGQPITESHKKKISNDCKKRQKKIDNLENDITINNKEIEKIELQILDLDSEIKKIRKIIDGWIHEFDFEISRLNIRVESDKKSIIQTSESNIQKEVSIIILEFKEKQEDLESKLRKLETEESELSKLLNKIVNYENEYSILGSNILELSKRYNDENEKIFDENKIKQVEINISKLEASLRSGKINKNKKERRIKILQSVKEAFSPSGVPNFLIDTGIPFMNKRCAELLDSVSQGRYSIVFDNISQIKTGEFRDKISTKTFDTRNLTNDRKQISGGQERLIDICVLIALNDLHSKVHQIDFNVLILDEIFDSLDDNNILSISGLLSLLAKEKSVNIISHTHIDGIQADRYFHL